MHLTLMLAIGLPILLCTVLAALVAVRAAHKSREQTTMQRFRSMQSISASALWSARGRNATTSISLLDSEIHLDSTNQIVASESQRSDFEASNGLAAALGAGLEVFGASLPSSKHGGKMDGGEMDGGKMDRKLDLDVKPDGKDGKETAARTTREGWI